MVFRVLLTSCNRAAGMQPTKRSPRAAAQDNCGVLAGGVGRTGARSRAERIRWRRRRRQQLNRGESGIRHTSRRTIRVRLAQTLDTKYARPGGRFSATLDDPIVLHDRVVVPREHLSLE